MEQFRLSSSGGRKERQLCRMDTKKARKNITYSIFFRIIILMLTIPVRSLMIKYLGNEVTGIFSLFNNIITVLSLAESGIGVSIIFSLYKYIDENHNDKITGLFNLFQKSYKIIGLSILILGIISSFFLPFFIDADISKINILIPFYVMILSTSISYLFASKISLINAYKDNYITTFITSIAYIIQYSFQIVVLVFFDSFILYTIIIFISIMIQWGLTTYFFNKNYINVLTSNPILLTETKQEVFLNIKSMLSHKIGNVLFNSTNGFIISYFLGVVILGVYNNYTTIIVSLVSILTLMFVSITSIIGHAYIKDQKDNFYKNYKTMQLINYTTAILCFLGFALFQDTVIPLVFNSGVYLSSREVILLTFGQFLQYTRQTNILFREATGIFSKDRFRPYYEVSLNLVLSIMLGKSFGVSGVLLANIIVTLLITSIIEPLILFRDIFNKSFTKEYLYYLYFLVVFGSCLYFSTLESLKMVSGSFIGIILSKGLLYVVTSIICIIPLFISRINRNILFRIGKKE